MSARSWSAVRASASATPPSSTSSSSGSTSCRNRLRRNPRSALCGSVHHVRSLAVQMRSVSVRRSPRNGRRTMPSIAGMPASERGPEPRPRPSSTVSAWSSRVWASSTASTGRDRSTAYLASRAAASGPPSVPTSTVTTSASRPSARACSAARSATSAESGWSPWSTTTAPAVQPAFGRDERQAGRERQRVGTTAQRDLDARSGIEVVEREAQTSPTFGDDRIQRAAHGSTRGRGRPRRRGRRCRPGWAGWPARPRPR